MKGGFGGCLVCLGRRNPRVGAGWQDDALGGVSGVDNRRVGDGGDEARRLMCKVVYHTLLCNAMQWLGDTLMNLPVL